MYEGLAHRRMSTLGLTGPRFAAPEAVVRHLCAVQSQDFGPALWSLRQRLTDATEEALLTAFDAGTFLRTHVLRPTWHFVLPADIRWMLELTAPRVHAFNAYYYRQHQLDAGVFERSHALIRDALTGGRCLTRKEIGAVLERGGVKADNLRLGLILMHAELERLICSGPRRGKQQTYVLLDERVPPGSGPTGDDALAELTRRYFASHGPASAKDFSWWSSLTMADVKKGLALVGDELHTTEVNGWTLWHVPTGSSSPTPVPVPTVHLLQPYDEYGVGYSETRGVADVAGLAALRPNRGAYVGIVVLDSQFAGYWKRTVRAQDVIIDVQLHRPLSDAENVALGVAANSVGEFLGKTAVVNPPFML
jgi:hypothetical protein